MSMTDSEKYSLGKGTLKKLAYRVIRTIPSLGMNQVMYVWNLRLFRDVGTVPLIFTVKSGVKPAKLWTGACCHVDCADIDTAQELVQDFVLWMHAKSTISVEREGPDAVKRTDALLGPIRKRQ